MTMLTLRVYLGRITRKLPRRYGIVNKRVSGGFMHAPITPTKRDGRTCGRMGEGNLRAVNTDVIEAKGSACMLSVDTTS
jgi:hypothetical protein